MPYQAQVEHAAFHDGRTDMPNQLLLSDRLASGPGGAERQQHEVAVCYLDLDGLKTVNDTHGHEAGDSVLQAGAARLLHGVRVGDTVTYLGGDECVVVLTPVL
nr:GGDEF domain-containing protein [uncultured Methylibium sp.]